MPGTVPGLAYKEWLINVDSLFPLSKLYFIDLILSEPKIQFNKYLLNPENRKMAKRLFPQVVRSLIRKIL